MRDYRGIPRAALTSTNSRPSLPADLHFSSGNWFKPDAFRKRFWEANTVILIAWLIARKKRLEFHLTHFVSTGSAFLIAPISSIFRAYNPRPKKHTNSTKMPCPACSASTNSTSWNATLRIGGRKQASGTPPFPISLGTMGRPRFAALRAYLRLLVSIRDFRSKICWRSASCFASRDGALGDSFERRQSVDQTIQGSVASLSTRRGWLAGARGATLGGGSACFRTGIQRDSGQCFGGASF